MTCDTHGKTHSTECRTITIKKLDSQLQNLHYQGGTTGYTHGKLVI